MPTEHKAGVGFRSSFCFVSGLAARTAVLRFFATVSR